MPFRLLLLSAALAALAGCGGPSFNGQTYRSADLTFRVGPQPPSWKRLEASAGRLAFRDEGSNASVLLNARCGEDGDDVPLIALRHHLFLQFTDREVGEEEVIPFDGREALRTIMTAKLDGVPKRFESYILKKDRCVYDFVLVSEPETFDAARPGFERFVTGFHVESR